MKYDWSKIQVFYDTGKTVTQCQQEFGFARYSWTKAVNAGRIIPRSRRKLLENLSPRSRRSIKEHLLAEGVPYACSLCGISSWKEKPLTLQLDHIDGNHNNHSRNNWRLLCPNCHSQTETFCGKNTKKAKKA